MNFFYDAARQRASEGGLLFISGTIKAMLVTAAYTPASATDSFVAIIPGAAILSRSSALTGKTNTAGILSADPWTFGFVTAGTVGKYVVIYRDTGLDATSELINCFDTGQNVPVTNDGGNDVVSQGSTPNKLGQI